MSVFYFNDFISFFIDKKTAGAKLYLSVMKRLLNIADENSLLAGKDSNKSPPEGETIIIITFTTNADCLY
jgi:hypothetical protein